MHVKVQPQFWISLVYIVTILLFFVALKEIGVPLLAYISLGLAIIFLSFQKRSSFFHLWSPFAAIMISYEALRYLYQPIAETRGVLNVFLLDKIIWGLNLTGLVQSSLGSKAMTVFMTLIYSLHIPLVITTAAILWVKRKDVFVSYSYILSICTYISFIFFLLFPSSPPWLAGAAQNLLNGSSGTSVYKVLSDIVESDPLATFPSLHAVYALLLPYIFFRLKRIYGMILLPLAVLILFSTVYLGQHYVIDLIAGGTIFAVSLLIAKIIS